MKTYSNRMVLAGMLMLALALPIRATAEDQQSANGLIQTIDSGRRSLAINTFDKAMTFRVADDATIATTNNPAAKLEELKIGDAVVVSYDQRFIAHSVVQRAGTESPPAAPPQAVQQQLLAPAQGPPPTAR